MTTTLASPADLADRIASDGWAIARHQLEEHEILSARTLIAAHFHVGHGVQLAGARVQPAAAHFVPGLAWLYAHPRVIELARTALGTHDIIFTGHSDAHHGFTQGWHKDSGSTALGDPLAGYFSEPTTSLFNRPPEVVKIGIYLQESTDLNCLRVDPGSHLRPDLQPLRPARVLMDAGDLVVFDSRLPHGNGANVAGSPRAASRASRYHSMSSAEMS